ncbi:MAG: PAS domain S-box protein [Desulfobacteraceae bacterium]|nr:MAG: PAS domain S-box protein [Desulfobacteraceae bacterium]
MENHAKLVFTLIIVTVLTGFLSFFLFYQQFTLKNAKARLNDHALVIANSLWRYEKGEPMAYMRLAAQSNNYEDILVTDDFGVEFARFKGPRTQGWITVFSGLGILPVHPLEKEIIFNGISIGTLKVNWQNRSAFTYFYILVCLALFLTGTWFFLGLVTAKKTLEARVIERTADLQESQDRLQAILDNAEAVIYLKDTNRRYLAVNKRFEELFNIDRMTLVGLKDNDIFNHDVASDFMKNDQEILEGKKALQFEEYAPDYRGNHRDYISVKFPLKKADGEVYAICGISTDITERKKAQVELNQLRNYLSNIIDSMPSVLIGVDLDGNITQWNNRARQATGLTAEEVLGRPLEHAYTLPENEMSRVKEAIANRKEMHSAKQPRLRNNEIRYEVITIYPLISNGVEGAVIRVDDATEQVQLEEMMVQSEKMLSVGGLAAGMAHEINNPLAGMIQSANVMKSRLSDLEMPANLAAAKEIGVKMAHIRTFMDHRGIFRMVDAINESGRRVAEIVDNMLSFARKGNSKVSSYHPEQLMDQILELAATDYDLKSQYDFKTIKIVKDYQKDLPMIPCEGAKIQQVLLNILRNGAQAMQSEPGSGLAPCFILRLSHETQSRMLRIDIEDNGPGMDATIQKRIFEPFFTTKPPGSGTGLGLSVSYFIVTENHQGSMDVSSIPGKGTVFTIRLPLDVKRNK